jgi:nitric oxide reductase NorD protein
MDAPARVRRVARALWGDAPQVHWQDAAPGALPAEAPRAVLVRGEQLRDDPALHLPRPLDDPDLAVALAAHAAAHLRFGGAAQARAGLKPVQQVLLAVLEDARVEWLALQELPGLRALWWPFHAEAASLGNGFDALLARLSASLLNPAHDDPHAWIAKVRRVFFAPDGTLALRTPGEVRDAASRLGNDIGQMRLPLNARTYRVHARYRDDNSHLWLPDATLPPSGLSLVADAAPPTDEALAALADTVATPPDARHPEWDHRIARYRRDWCSVYSAPLPPGPADTGGALAATRQHLVRRLARLGAARRPGPERDRDGDALHPVALVDAALDGRAGRTPDPRVHRRPRAAPPPLAVLLLLDASASTAQADGGAWLAALQSHALAAAQALQALGHRSALWAFSSQGRHRVHMPCLLPWDAPAQHRAPRLPGGGSTRLGAALRHALHLSAVDARRHPGWRRLIVLLTDGEAHDIDVHDPAYLPADLQRAAREAAARRVAVQGLVFAHGRPGPLAAALGPGAVHRVRSPAEWPRAMARPLAAAFRAPG